MKSPFGDFFFLGDAMTADAFSNCHPAVNFLFFVGAIGFSVLIQHPAYLIAGAIGAAVYYLLLSGRAGWKRIAMLLPMFLALTVVNPLFNTYGERVLFYVFGRPYTVEALLYGAAIAGVFLVMMLWFGCYNAVMTSDKFLFLFGQIAPNTALLITMTLGLIPRLQERSAQIRTAQKMLLPENKRLLPRLHAANRNLSALLTWSMENAVQTADSMKARGYGVRRRTTFHLFVFDSRDAAVLGLILALAGICVLGRVFGHGTMEFYPRMDAVFTGVSGTVLYIAFAVLALFPSILEMKEKLTWRCCGLTD